MKTGIITTDTYLNHDTGQGHPERADRVTVVIDHLKKVKSKNLIWKKPAKFDLKYLEFAHDKNYLDSIKDSFPRNGLNFLDDLYVEPKNRGQKIGEKLINRIKEISKSKGWNFVRWITRDDNVKAKSLYDRISEKTNWNVYELK